MTAERFPVLYSSQLSSYYAELAHSVFSTAGNLCSRCFFAPPDCATTLCNLLKRPEICKFCDVFLSQNIIFP